MKHGKKPTVRQCKLIQSKRLNPADWLIVKDTPEEMVIVHRHSDTVTKTIPKNRG